MFTGLVEEVGVVESVRTVADGGELVMRCPGIAEELVLGESVACDGVCLTVTRQAPDRFWADFSVSTAEVTTVGTWRPGRRVNLERALRLGDRLGGHLVTGHVDVVGRLLAKRPLGPATRLDFGLPAAFARQLVAKGSVAVNGTSLTVNEVSADGFAVTIIPHTGARTTLLELSPGDAVNVETDVLGKHVERLLEARLGAGSPAASTGAAGGLTAELLERSGF